MIVECPTCFRRVERVDQVDRVLQEGGARRPEQPPALGAWRVWARSLRGELGPVVGACTACGAPCVGLEASRDLMITDTLSTPGGAVHVGPAGLRGPAGTLTVDEADRFIRGQLERPVWRDWADPRGLFLLGPALIFAVMAVGWVIAASYVINFVLAAGLQGDLSMPLTR